MRPILWLDQQILKFFTKIAKDINWLTGVDNFCLAKVVLVISGIVSICMHNWLELLVLLSICCPLWLIIDLAKSSSEKVQLRGIKVLSDHLADQNFRLNCLILLVLVIIFEKQISYVIPATEALWLVAYLITIDHSLFKKSQAWEKIRNWAGSLSAQPQAETIPVRSN